MCDEKAGLKARLQANIVCLPKGQSPAVSEAHLMRFRLAVTQPPPASLRGPEADAGEFW